MFKKAIISLIFIFLPLASLAQTAAADELGQILTDLHSMQADFVEKSAKSSHAKLVPKSYGQMAIYRPGKFRWEITRPSKQLLIADSKYIWVYDADLAQVTKRKINYNEPGNPALLLSGAPSALGKAFVIKKIDDLSSKENLWFELKPKNRDESNNIQQVKLHFKGNKLVGMQIADNLGQHSNLDFSKIKANTTLPDELFKFNPPRGVDVIEN